VDSLLIARWQMAFTLGSHIILACLGVGLPVLMLAAEWFSLRTNDPLWRALAHRWSKAFAVLFAVGAVSGTVLSFELGILWPKFMGTFGSVIGLPFTLEGFAFFLEAIFAGIYLYGWNKLPPRIHWWTGVPIALSGVASASFVVTANAWMNAPRGFTMRDGVVIDVDPIAAMTGPTAAVQIVHMLLAAYMVTGFLVAAFYACVLWNKPTCLYSRRAMLLALWMGTLASFPQGLAGDWAAKTVARTQPIKLAAMEGQFKTETGAPLRIGGWPDTTTRETNYDIEIPYALSILAYGDPHATVQGLDDFPRENQPPVVVVHIAFQIMVGLGTLLMALGGWTILSWWMKWHPADNRWVLLAIIASGPATVLAMEAGWVVTEVGRQPWIAHNVMRTKDAASQIPGLEWLFLATLAIYLALFAGLTIVLRLLAVQPIPTSSNLSSNPAASDQSSLS
jgi:cytochrome d ubiquinol oxidase subunit I